MSDTVLLSILGVSLFISLIIVIRSIRRVDKQISQLAFYMHQIHQKVAQQRYIDKNLENFKIGSLKYILIGARLYITAIMEQSVADERYEDAQRCKNVINEISKLINF